MTILSSSCKVFDAELRQHTAQTGEDTYLQNHHSHQHHLLHENFFTQNLQHQQRMITRFRGKLEMASEKPSIGSQWPCQTTSRE